MYYYIYSNELAHYGILGMKWGIRRFQNPDGTLTELGKRRYGTENNLEDGTTLNKIKRDAKTVEKVIRSGNPKRVSRNVNKMNDDDFKRAVARIKQQEELNSYLVTKLDAAKSKVSAWTDIIGKVKTSSEHFVDMYNNFAKAWNSFNPDSPLKMIKEQKNLTAAEQKILYELNKSKKEAQRAAYVENIFRNADAQYIFNHMNEFTTDEINDFINRLSKMKDMKDWV